jgi:hypothetical protein
MNGRRLLSSLVSAFSSPADRKRLLAALAISLLLHAAVILLPLPGKGRPTGGPAAAGKGKGPFAFTITLATTETGRRSTQLSPPEGGLADLPPSPPELADGREQRSNPASGRTITYYPAPQLTKHPQPLVQGDLDPPDIQSIIASGSLILDLWIDDRGEVTDVVVEEGNLPEVFVAAVVTAFKQSRFQPGERFGQPVGTVMRVAVTFADRRLPAPIVP